MEIPTIDNTDAYIDVCKKAGLPVNKLPKKGDKLDLAYEMAMKEINPHLYQNIVNPDPDELPVKVAKRYKQGLMWIDDLKAYEDAGFTGTAKQIRDAIEEAQVQRMNNEAEAMRKRTEARDKAIREKPPGFKGLAPLSPESIARARAEWGITGN